jgi:TctA family transporter
MAGPWLLAFSLILSNEANAVTNTEIKKSNGNNMKMNKIRLNRIKSATPASSTSGAGIGIGPRTGTGNVLSTTAPNNNKSNNIGQLSRRVVMDDDLKSLHFFTSFILHDV